MYKTPGGGEKKVSEAVMRTRARRPYAGVAWSLDGVDGYEAVVPEEFDRQVESTVSTRLESLSRFRGTLDRRHQHG
jgi:hypothetical protein